jgi:hypothetical protein
MLGHVSATQYEPLVSPLSLFCLLFYNRACARMFFGCSGVVVRLFNLLLCFCFLTSVESPDSTVPSLFGSATRSSPKAA